MALLRRVCGEGCGPGARSGGGGQGYDYSSYVGAAIQYGVESLTDTPVLAVTPWLENPSCFYDIMRHIIHRVPPFQLEIATYCAFRSLTKRRTASTSDR